MARNVSHQISKEFKNIGTLILDAYSEIKLLSKVYNSTQKHKFGKFSSFPWGYVDR